MNNSICMQKNEQYLARVTRLECSGGFPHEVCGDWAVMAEHRIR